MGILTMNGGQFQMDGKPYRILSGAVHYFRVVPQYWEDRLRKLKACGLNTVETYTCWNLHERREGQFDFSGILDIQRYLQTAQDLGLNVILRPGPYICAEWDFGGLPSWLLSCPGMELRCSNPLFLEKVGAYFRELFSRIRPYLCTNGGNIILVQVENEYGSYGNDRNYLLELEKLYRENGIDCMLFTSDGTQDWMLNGGTLPHLPAASNFGSDPQASFQSLRKYRPGGPLLCGEFWSGWFDHWYEQHHTRTPENIASDVEALMDSGASFNLYMFHGGTNFGFTSGANHTGTEYQPMITSYDYCAPVSECGDLTPAYYRIREIIQRRTGTNPAGLEVHNLPKAAYGTLALTEAAPLLEQVRQLSRPVHAPQVKTMEQLGQDFGYLLYSTTLHGPFAPLELDLGRVHDRAIVFLNGKRAGLQERSRHHDRILLSLEAGETARLDILVENMGRVNYGRKLADTKGLPDGVCLGQQFHFGWDMYCLTMENLSGLLWQKESRPGELYAPVFLRGSLNIAGTPADTFVRFGGFTKGFCMVNGFLLGRFFNSAGPQKTLYLPAPLLHPGENEIIVFESDGYDRPEITFVSAPELG